jgi:PilZ domain
MGHLVCSVATANDLRRYPRLSAPKGTILAWENASMRHVSYVANLGLGGLYIRTREAPPPGTFIRLLLDAPTGEVRARAVVQRSNPKEGMGVKIVAMQQEDRARFARWLKCLTS